MCGMAYVNRDNLRHLTGHGREVAAFLEHVMSTWYVDEGSPQEAGNLQVIRDDSVGEFRAKFIPYSSKSSEAAIAGHELADENVVSIIVYRDGLRETTVVPLVMILTGVPDYSKYHQVYQHDFVRDGKDEPIQNARYIGVTKRGWRTRWAEHLRAAKSGSQYRFHRAIREWHGVARSTTHMIVALCPSEKGAMDIEEGLVARDSLYPLGLNMIPGGRAGLAYLQKIGALGANERVAVDDRQAIVNRFFERTASRGLPNPLAAANWLNANYAERVICSGPDRLRAHQVRDARFFASLGQDASQIATRVGARNTAQIERVLSGSTYARIA